MKHFSYIITYKEEKEEEIMYEDTIFKRSPRKEKSRTFGFYGQRGVYFKK